MAAPNVFLGGGTHAAGAVGTPSAGGAACSGGSVIIDPITISLAGSDTRIQGHDIFIYSDDGGTLELRNLSSDEADKRSLLLGVPTLALALTW